MRYDKFYQEKENRQTMLTVNMIKMEINTLSCLPALRTTKCFGECAKLTQHTFEFELDDSGIVGEVLDIKG